MSESPKRPGSNRKLRVFLESIGFVAAAWGVMIFFAGSILAGMMLKAMFSRLNDVSRIDLAA